jgi:hypothetical protein
MAVGTLLSDLSSSVEWWLPRHSTERSAVPLSPRERRGLLDSSVTPKGTPFTRGTLFTRFAFLKSRINNPPRSQHPVRPGGIAGNDVGPLHSRAVQELFHVKIPIFWRLADEAPELPPGAAAHHRSLNRRPPSRPSLIEQLIDIRRTKFCKVSFFWARRFAEAAGRPATSPPTS